MLEFSAEYVIEDFETETPKTEETKELPYRPSKEDELYLWCIGLQNRICGKTAPSTTKGEGSRERVRYDCLIDSTNAVFLINSVSDLPPISAKTWTGICKRFRHLEPPYDSFHRKG